MKLCAFQPQHSKLLSKKCLTFFPKKFSAPKNSYIFWKESLSYISWNETLQRIYSEKTFYILGNPEKNFWLSGGNLYFLKKKNLYLIFFIRIFFIKFFFTTIFFIRIFFIWIIQRNVYVVSNKLFNRLLFFCDNIFTFFWRPLRRIFLIFLINWIE